MSWGNTFQVGKLRTRFNKIKYNSLPLKFAYFDLSKREKGALKRNAPQQTDLHWFRKETLGAFLE